MSDFPLISLKFCMWSGLHIYWEHRLYIVMRKLMIYLFLDFL